MRKWLRGEKRLDKETESQYRKRVKGYATRMLSDLALVAKTEKLSEKEMTEVFNIETMRPFFSALLALKPESKERRDRVIGIWNALFGSMSGTYGMSIVSNDVWRALTLRGNKGLGTLETLEAIYYATMFRKKDEEKQSETESQNKGA